MLPIILLFTIVVLSLSLINPETSIFLSAKAPNNLSPFASFPITPKHIVFAPKDAKLFTTLAAPPNTNFSSFTLTTGTGASGDILSTVP